MITLSLTIENSKHNGKKKWQSKETRPKVQSLTVSPNVDVYRNRTILMSFCTLTLSHIQRNVKTLHNNLLLARKEEPHLDIEPIRQYGAL